MNISTHYAIGDTCFFLHPEFKKIFSAPVYRIDIEITDDEIRVKYWFRVAEKFCIVYAGDVFSTQEEVISHLIY